MLVKKVPYAELSPREHEVAELLAEGHSNKAIATRLMISDHTAKFHVRNLMIKMGARNRAGVAVKYAHAGVQAVAAPQRCADCARDIGAAIERALERALEQRKEKP